MAGKALTQAQIVTKLSESQELTKAQTKGFLEALAALAYKESKNGLHRFLMDYCNRLSGSVRSLFLHRLR